MVFGEWWVEVLIIHLYFGKYTNDLEKTLYFSTRTGHKKYFVS